MVLPPLGKGRVSGSGEGRFFSPERPGEPQTVPEMKKIQGIPRATGPFFAEICWGKLDTFFLLGEVSIFSA